MIDTGRRSFGSGVSFRFAGVLALALLPIGFVSILQTDTLQTEISARADAALLGATLRAAEGETNVIRHAQGLVGGLAAIMPTVLDNNEVCVQLMKDMLKVEPAVAVVAFVPVDNQTTCASTGLEYDFSADPNTQLAHAQRAPFLFVNPAGPVSGVSILGVSRPVFDATDTYRGFVGLSLPHKALRELQVEPVLTGRAQATPVIFWTFDKTGTLLTASIELDRAAALMPSDASLIDFVDGSSRVFEATAQNGVRQTYTVVPIIAGDLYLMSSWKPGTSMAAEGTGMSSYLPTVLMWLAGLVSAAFAAERFVTRHLRTLNSAIVKFAKGDRRLQHIDTAGAPVEIEELATAFVAMTDSITRSEADLEDSVHQKEVLLREVHHRVKNNLQLISSIMNIQIRNAKSGEAKELVKNLQERIMSLATVHRGLYQTSGLADVKARELIPDIVRQIMSLSSGSDRPFETKLEIDDLRLVPDQAVPLSLLLAEAITNAIKHAGATRGKPGQLLVRLKRSGGSDAVLEIINSRNTDLTASPDAINVNTGLGTQLIVAFVQQLGGPHETELTETSHALRVTFRLSPLARAENRQVSHLNLAEVWND